MGAPISSGSTFTQWLFPLPALVNATPSRSTSSISLEKELYDRARGVEFLFRLGVSLALPSSAMYTAATWFHRFYMRHSMEDYHRQDVAAACIFLATKTEECGRKLRDVAKIYCAKVSKTDPKDIADDSKEVEESQTAILLTEEVLLEALCFEFVIPSPQADLVDLFDAHEVHPEVEEFAWSIANDTYRTPLCILYPPRIIAAACYVLAQHVVEGPESASLSARISSPAPSASLPTPPSHKPTPPEASRFAVEFFAFNEVELASVADVLAIILEFYSAQDIQSSAEYIASVAAISPPTSAAHRERLYLPFAFQAASQHSNKPTSTPEAPEQPSKTQQNGISPTKSSARGWVSVKGEGRLPDKIPPRLDLS